MQVEGCDFEWKPVNFGLLRALQDLGDSPSPYDEVRIGLMDESKADEVTPAQYAAWRAQVMEETRPFREMAGQEPST